jgi:alpha-glucosidase (family GH31 glycosyl hydrolase)
LVTANTISMKYLSIFVLLCFLGCSDEKPALEPAEIEWEKEYPGVWKSTVGHPAQIDLLKAAQIAPKKQGIEAMGQLPFPIRQTDIKADIRNGKTYLQFPLHKGEQIYGLGLNFKNVDQRGKIFRLHVDHYGGRDNGRTHAPVPFYVSSEGYGVLINAARYIDIYIGTGLRKDSKTPAQPRDRNTDKNWTASPYSEIVEVVVPGDGVELIVFAGKNIQEVVQRYNLYCGGGYLPPKWGLGFWQRTPTLYTDQDVQKEIDDFKINNFPLDVIGLEPGWHSSSYPCTFEWDHNRYTNPEKFIKDLSGQGIRVNLWLNPYVSPESSLYQKIEPYTGTHTVWNGIVPDFTMEKAANIMSAHFKRNLLDIGVSGFKIDEVDGYDNWLWPDNAFFPSGLDGETMRQIYGLLVQKWSADLFKEKNQRTYGLVRGSNAGASSFPYVIYNDYYRHEDFITALINSSFGGILWTPEVRKSNTTEEWLRRMQTVCFSPMAMINAWADGTKPWSFQEVYAQCQEVAFLRMRLLPYIYSTFAKYYFEGIPPFRAMVMEDGFTDKVSESTNTLSSDENPYATTNKQNVKDQYMMGEYILVAPLFSGQKDRFVILPQGNWYNFYTGEYAGNGEVIYIENDMAEIPLFVKDGGIIPMMPAIRQIAEWNDNTPLEVRAYGNKDGSFELYDDDGSSFDFIKGKYSIMNLRTVDGTGLEEEMISEGPWTYGEISWKFMSE